MKPPPTPLKDLQNTKFSIHEIAYYAVRGTDRDPVKDVKKVEEMIEDYVKENNLAIKYLLKLERWYIKHQKHIDNLIVNEENQFPPTEIYDLNNPMSLKPAHWKWFIVTYH